MKHAARETTRMGYCSICKQNMLHVRQAVGRWRLAIEIVTLKLSRFLGQGPWQCCQCDQCSRFLQRNQEKTATKPESTRSDFTIDGNFIRQNQSLVLQKQRTARFSQKYRDGMIQRLLSGSSRMSHICRDLGITEDDVMTWMADLLHRREERIKELEKLLSQQRECRIEMSDDFLRDNNESHDKLSSKPDDVL